MNTECWHALFYRRAYGKTRSRELPDNFYVYIFGWVWLLLVMPVTWIGYFFVNKDDALMEKFWITVVTYFMTAIVTLTSAGLARVIGYAPMIGAYIGLSLSIGTLLVFYFAENLEHFLSKKKINWQHPKNYWD